jgi:hypothetical protein
LLKIPAWIIKHAEQKVKGRLLRQWKEYFEAGTDILKIIR